MAYVLDWRNRGISFTYQGSPALGSSVDKNNKIYTYKKINIHVKCMVQRYT